MPKKTTKDKHFAWVIAYIDSKFINLIKPQLARNKEYEDVDVFIPTVKVLKKTFKGEDHFDEVPLLFYYGFFKIPRVLATSRNYLDNMEKNVSAIVGWVKDPAKIIKKRKGEKMKGDDRYVPAATATSKQISELVKASQNIGAHSAEDLNMLRPGDIITLRGYPWDGVEAEFVRMDPKRKKVIIKLTMIGQRELEVSFDNVFFTIYANHGYDDSLTIRNSLDDMQAKNTLDKFTDKIQKRNGSKTE